MRKVKAVQDESGHWYVIPDELILDFFTDHDNEELVDCGAFSEKWSRYMTGGDLNLIQLYAEV